jgi:hypothetical protein
MAAFNKCKYILISVRYRKHCLYKSVEAAGFLELGQSPIKGIVEGGDNWNF